MRYLTDWWGVVLKAESAADAEQLRILCASIEGQKGSYECGEAALHDPVDGSLDVAASFEELEGFVALEMRR